METSNLNRRDASESTHAAPGDNTTVADTGSRADGNNPCSFPANNVVHQRRRVNPESLALRLGPDLVRDLDALITHGNTEMPSFAVRKELQERYNIDRRHIYDYFHSRGLRVVKEDKHGNPMTARDTPTPLPNLRPLRQAPVKNVRSHPYSIAAERKLFKPRGVTKAKPGRPKKNPPVNPKVVPITCETDESNESPDTNDAPVSENSPDEVPTPVYITVNPLLPHISLPSPVEEDDGCTFNSVVNPLDESFSVRRATGDVASAHRHKLVFERTQELTEYHVKLALTDDRSLSWNETSPCSAYDKGLLPNAKPLTSDERQAIYESMSDSLGPAQGIQECQGTYRKYMHARTKLYFEGLLSIHHHHSQQPGRTSTIPDRKPSVGTNEFSHWLSETRFLKRDGTNGSPRLHISHRNANVAKQQDTDGATRKQDRLSIPHWIQTLDVLFPAPRDALDTNNTMTDSPVVHTQEVTRITTQARGVADECSAGGRLPFSVTPSPDLPITSVAETQQTGHAELHGRSGFPGTQEVKTRIPFSDMDSHPQWPEHVPYASHSGQRLALNDTQRRGRNISSNARIRLPPCSPRKPQIRDLDRIWTRPVTTRDARRRTPSAAGDI
ncbi:hypothetical protein JVT61DRAFT_5218 [Boletus reticuloceps]|uniref:Uncharacterized protein n=1 Tax=Boletus reticuloceps TaxID=495285 RepID=A0A8I2Z029_9AGAM|nr:hypothetical protein JVT61DRAFT_5218 [Boletus reticuloceps]